VNIHEEAMLYEQAALCLLPTIGVAQKQNLTTDATDDTDFQT
jgi:hypothetical protein